MESKLMKIFKEAAANNGPIVDIVLEEGNNRMVIRVDRANKDAVIIEHVKDGIQIQKSEKEKKEMLGFLLLSIALEAYENGLTPEDRERLSTLVSIFEVKSR